MGGFNNLPYLSKCLTIHGLSSSAGGEEARSTPTDRWLGKTDRCLSGNEESTGRTGYAQREVSIVEVNFCRACGFVDGDEGHANIHLHVVSGLRSIRATDGEETR